MQHSETFIEDIRTNQLPAHTFISGEYDYDLLSNEKYQKMFNFVPLELREYKTSIMDLATPQTTKKKYDVDLSYINNRNINYNDAIFYILSIGSNKFINKEELLFEN